MEELVPILARSCRVTVVDTEKALSSCSSYISGQSFTELVGEMYQAMLTRNNHYKDAGLDSTVLDAYDERCYVIFGIKRLFEQLDEDARGKLAVLLEKADPLYKLHFVICDAESQIKAHEYDGWYKLLISGADGVWVGDGIADQFTLKVRQTSTELYQEVGEGFGYVVSKNRPILTKLLSSDAKGGKKEDE